MWRLFAAVAAARGVMASSLGTLIFAPAMVRRYGQWATPRAIYNGLEINALSCVVCSPEQRRISIVSRLPE